MRRRPRPTFKLYQKSLSFCRRLHDGIMVRTKSRRICRAGAEGVFRRNAISRESPVHQRQVGGLEPTVAREHVCGPDVISTATVNGAREGARVEIMSVGCPQTAGRASRSGQVPDYLSRNIPSAYAPPHDVRQTSPARAKPLPITALGRAGSGRGRGRQGRRAAP